MFPPADLLYPFYTILSFFSFLLPIIPLTWHLQAWNSGTCFYMVWASLIGLIDFVNSIIWAGTVLDIAPIWCDFSTHVLLAGTFAIPLSSLCIIRRLYLISSAKSALTRIEKRRAVIFDTILCLIIPLVLTALQYIVQGHRYCIYEEIGCMPYVYRTLAAQFLITAPPILTGLVSAYYDIRCITALFHHYLELKNLGASNNDDSFTMDRFIPVVVFAIVETSTTPIAAFALAMNITAGLLPWVSWDYVHADFSFIPVFPSVVWRSDSRNVAAVELQRWVNSSCGILIFLFFGTTKEARKHYSKAFYRLKCKLGSKNSVLHASDESSDTPDYSLTEASLPVIDIRRESFRNPSSGVMHFKTEDST
ncbi:fungal pheromone STE3G-protein-coupled receptor [Lentinula aff. detonsa]|nr:fungal pheromone STE3G-protein-coupled receptor [Lentinula aff. detonsa]